MKNNIANIMYSEKYIYNIIHVSSYTLTRLLAFHEVELNV